MEKISKETALYHEPPFAHGNLREFISALTAETYPCKRCGNFSVQTLECKRVEGKVMPHGHCFYWAILGLRPTIPAMTKPWRGGVLGLGIYGEEDSGMEGNLTDHVILRGNPKFMGYGAIDLKASGPFTIRFAYPTDIDVLFINPSGMGERRIIAKKKMHFRKNEIWNYSAAKAAAWGAYPGVTEIWFQQGGGKSQY